MGATRRRLLRGVAGASIVPIAASGGAAGSAAVQDAAVDVSITETNSPVETGGVLEVTADVANQGSETVSTDAVLVVGHDPTVVDTQPITVEPGASESVGLTFETAVVDNDQEFPVWVVVNDAADRTNVLVYADAPPVDVTIVESNDPVATGEYLEVTARLTNEAGTTVTQDAEFVVGHDPTQVDSATVTIGPNDSETVALGFETAIVDNDQEFPVRVETASDADERTVLVTAGEPSVAVDIVASNDPVSAGEYLEVSAQLENTGGRSVTETVEFIVGHDPTQVDSATATLEAGATETVSLGYTTYPAAQTTEFPVRAVGSNDEAVRTVTVYGTDS